MNFDAKQHWERIYQSRAPTEVSWYQAAPTTSLVLIRASGVSKRDRILDVGGGASNLVDALVEEGFENVSVIDISAAALEKARTRLGERSRAATWIEADIREFKTVEGFDLWHDRAVFHFFTEAEDREKYRAALDSAVKRGGQVIIATFALDGPQSCSGLPVARYSSESLSKELGRDFELLEVKHELHRTPQLSSSWLGRLTPWGRSRRQSFIYCRFRRKA